MYNIGKDIVSKIDKVLSEEIDAIDKELSVKDEVREKLIKITREIIRDSSNCVSSIHLGRISEAKEIIENIRLKVDELKNLLKDHPDLYHSGTVYNALSEYVECLSLYSILTGKGIPRLSDLDIPIPPYLQGLGDLVGELRRIALELLREDKVSEAQTVLDVMETLYHRLRSLHYPDALTPGLRHKVDVARRLVEDTKALIVDLASRKKLEAMIKKYVA